MIVISFGFKHGEPAADNLTVIDLRRMQNPWHRPFLRELPGTHSDVIKHVSHDPLFEHFLKQGEQAAHAGRDVAYGCTGGKHRSVVLANALAGRLQAVGVCVTVQHTALVTP